MTDDDAKSARESMEQSRLEVMDCEEEIKSVKNELKSIAASSSGMAAEEQASNHLEVAVLKIGHSEGAAGGDGALPTTFKVHVSSPIEDRTITKLYDPLDPADEEGVAKFDSIETSNALLIVDVLSINDDDESSTRKIGTSAPHDLQPLCQDMELWREGGEKKKVELDVVIVSEGGIDDASEEAKAEHGAGEKETSSPSSDSWEDAVAEEEDTNKKGGEENNTEESSPKDDSNGEDDEEFADAQDVAESPKATSTSSKLQLPLYTLTLQLEYTPSLNDKRDALYDKLNEVSKRKVAAIESLRKNAGIVNRSKMAEAEAGGASTSMVEKNRAVKAGFLNKSPKATKPDPFWKRWYNKALGPQSLLWVVGPVAKNYFIFAGVSLFIHFKGDLLALPPPV